MKEVCKEIISKHVFWTVVFNPSPSPNLIQNPTVRFSIDEQLKEDMKNEI